VRAVAFTPAVRGYPGGIADMAVEPDGLAAEGPPDSSGSWAADPAVTARSSARQQTAAPAASGGSVWQQSLAAWQEAGIDWLHEARPVLSPEDRAAAEADLQHTQPIPVVPALDPAGAAPAAAVPGADEDAGVPADAGGAANASAEIVTAAGTDAAGSAGPAAGTGSGAAGTVAGAPQGAGRGSGAGPGAPAGKPGRARPGKRVIIVAAATSIAVLAGTIAGVAIAGSGPAKPTFGLVTPYPAATLADGDFAAQAAGPGLAPTLTGVASAGKTVVAVGAQGTGPLSLPLILVSTSGGRTWARAALGHSDGAVGPGAVPVLIARGRDSWLALGQHSAWTSTNGQAWQAAPGVPMAAGDKILALARTRSGFIAVGENVPGPAGSGVPRPVLWTSAGGQSWQRKSGAALALGDSGKPGTGGGAVVSLRWAAYRGSVIIVGGEISRSLVKHRGKRKIIVNVVSPGLWRSKDGGASWQPVTVPLGHGAAAGLAGIAATGPAFVAIRPGRTRTGRRDAVAYVSGTGTGWRYAGRITAGRRSPLHVRTVAASGQMFVVSGTTGIARVAFVSVRGRAWRQAANQGRSDSTTVTGVAVAPGSAVVTAGSRHVPGSRAGRVSPYLLLAGTGAGAHRTLVGGAALAAAGTADAAVNSLAATAEEQVAAGTAGGAPALWWAPGDGHWTPAVVPVPASWGSGSLASVVHGDAGWLAVGQTEPRARSLPAGLAMTSTDGKAWHALARGQPLTAAGTSLAQAAAGPAGYVVVGGAAGTGGAAAPAAWYSAGLSTWARAAVTGAGAGGAPGRMLAVTADRSGFAAAGSAGNAPAVWSSRTGSAWRLTVLPRPAGTTSAALTQVTAVGARVVAAGTAVRAGMGQQGPGPVSFAAVSSDGGRTWREAFLRGPAGPSTVTALTAAGQGLVAAGLSGETGNQAMLIWWSPDGLSWQGGEPVAGPLPGRGVQQLTALSAAGGALTGAGYAVTPSGEHPVRWQARYR
jgi:hypothetical protein